MQRSLRTLVDPAGKKTCDLAELHEADEAVVVLVDAQRPGAHQVAVRAGEAGLELRRRGRTCRTPTVRTVAEAPCKSTALASS